MFPTGSFERMKNDLEIRECKKGTDIPITVGILVADYRRQFCKENIFNQLERFDKRSGPLIDFYIPGYCMTSEIDEHYTDSYKFKNRTYSFSSELFDSFVDILEQRDVEITGHAQLILITYANGHFIFNESMIFDLEQDEGKGKIKSAKLFFDFIFDIAKKTVEFERFRKTIMGDRRKNAMTDFLKVNLPSALLSLLLDPLKNMIGPQQ